MRQHRISKALQQRPLIFVCHSTGGIVVKEALCTKSSEGEPSLASVCIGMTFFATPHHGSGVLSGPEFGKAVKIRLGLKWDMSNHLSSQFAVRNQYLELLNHRFGAASLGIKIWNYYETCDTQLKVLTSGDNEGENLTKINLCVVDQPSAKMSTADVLIEEEQFIPTHTNHIGAARFANDESLRSRYCEGLKTFIGSTSARDREIHHSLITSIMTQVLVDVHQFYQIDVAPDAPAMKVWSEYPNLGDLLELGPAACLKRRLQPVRKGHHVDKVVDSSTKMRHVSEPSAPIITVAPPAEDVESALFIDPDLGIDQLSCTNADVLGVSPSAKVSNIHTRRPSLPKSSSALEGGHLNPEGGVPDNAETQFDATRLNGHERIPQRAHTYQMPTRSRDRFRWIHVPYTHAGWVSQVLATIAREKCNLGLHQKLLSDPVWTSHHNRSRHASSHARFVRSSCKSLLPRGSLHHHVDEMILPSSAINQVQFALYMPYLFWDSFRRLQARASVIQKRGTKPPVLPIDQNIIKGKSIEDKLIWQYLNSNRPIHCRRTLDQYGYPSLRNTAVRDADQVLYKQTRGQVQTQEATVRGSSMQHISAILHASRATGSRPSKVKTVVDSTAKVLMVDQLWLWILDDGKFSYARYNLPRHLNFSVE